jgi:hypothetical protein
LATYDPFAPWNTPGWTPFNNVPLVNTPNGTTPAVQDWPTDLDLITLTGEYRDPNGYPVQGIVRFHRYVPVNVGGVWVAPGQVVGTVDEGTLSVELPASNDPDSSPPFVYHVKECFPGGREYNIIVPFDATGPVELWTLETTETDETVTVDTTYLEVVIGASFTREFAYLQESGEPEEGLTDFDAHFVLVNSSDVTVLDATSPYATGGATVTFDSLTATATVTFNTTYTGSLPAGRYTYGLELDDGSTVIPLVPSGTLIVKDSVA